MGTIETNSEGRITLIENCYLPDRARLPYAKDCVIRNCTIISRDR